MIRNSAKAIVIQDGVISSPDGAQVAVEWVDLTRLEEVELYPRALRNAFRRVALGETVKVSWGDRN